MSEATMGKVHAQIIRTTKECPLEGSGLHYHDLAFQMVLILRGESRVWFENHGEVELFTGDCWIQPPKIKHNVMYYSNDYELLKLTMPAEYKTVNL